MVSPTKNVHYTSFIYIRPARRAWILTFMELKACFQSDRNGDGQPGRAATGA